MNYIFCPRCEESLPETCYYTDNRRKNGKRTYCKACEAERHLQWRLSTGRTKRSNADRWAQWDCSK